MPELPDVEGFRRVLTRAAGRPVDRVDVLDPGTLRDGDAARLARELRHRVLATPRRHGKWLLAPVRSPRARHHPGDPTLAFHFGMTGVLVWSEQAEPRHRHDRVVLGFGDRELRYRDMRKLQGIRLPGDDETLADLLKELGPDADGLSAREMRQRLAGRHGQLKPALLDQRVVAGLGNLLVDEILWRARLDPHRHVPDLGTADHRPLHRAMRTVLRHSIERGRVPAEAGWLTGRRADRDAACPRCGKVLLRERVGGRSTVWCPSCQRT